MILDESHSTDQGPEKEGSEQRAATSLNKCFAPE